MIVLAEVYPTLAKQLGFVRAEAIEKRADAVPVAMTVVTATFANRILSRRLLDRVEVRSGWLFGLLCRLVRPSRQARLTVDLWEGYARLSLR